MTAATSDAAEQNRLGLAAGRRGDLVTAEAHFRAAVERQPDLAQAYNNLGVALEMQGKAAEAAQAYRQAIAAHPNYVEAYHNLGVACTRMRQYQTAVDCCRRAISLRPDYVDAYNGLGVALQHLDQFSEAADCFRRVAAARPDFAPAHSNLAAVLQKLGEVEAAIVHLQRAIELEPANVAAHVNLGLALKQQKKSSSAEQALQRALQLDPSCSEAHVNLGSLLECQTRSAEAEQSFSRALALDPQCAEAHIGLALSLMRRGDFIASRDHYRWRDHFEDLPKLTFAMPEWEGSPLAGRRILLREDQGAGDTIQFVRFAQQLAEDGGRVIVQTRERLMNLLRTCPGVHQVISLTDPLPECDVYALLSDLGGLTKMTMETLPAHVPYLSGDPNCAESWRAEWQDTSKLKVGINWQGDPRNKGDTERSISLSHFASLVDVPGVQLFSVQFGHGREQLSQIPEGKQICDLGDRLGDFYQTAGLMQNLDLLITCDSSPAHLAGALGVPVWVALAQVSDWRWFHDRAYSPWYPSMRLFSQRAFGQWSDVFERIHASLAAVAAQRTTGLISGA